MKIRSVILTIVVTLLVAVNLCYAKKSEKGANLRLITKVTAYVLKNGTRGENPSHTFITVKDEEKTIHYTVYHIDRPYRFAVIVIEPTEDGGFMHTSLVDLINSETGPIFDGWIDICTKDSFEMKDGYVKSIKPVQVDKKSGQEQFVALLKEIEKKI
jgi:hypothetical protein